MQVGSHIKVIIHQKFYRSNISIKYKTSSMCVHVQLDILDL